MSLLLLFPVFCLLKVGTERYDRFWEGLRLDLREERGDDYRDLAGEMLIERLCLPAM